MRNISNGSQRENPFDLTKASDYSDQQVKDYWVDVTGVDSLVNFLKPTSVVPILLLGGKGSGKTHLMRYCSSTVQELRCKSLRQAIIEEKYLGIYTSADGLNVQRFSGKGQSHDVWETVFAYSFELWLVSCMLTSLRPALSSEELLSEGWNRSIVDRISDLMKVTLPKPLSNFDEIISYVDSLRGSVDRIVNNTAITRQLTGIEIIFNPGDLIFGIPKIIAELCSFAVNTIFVYLIDEVENFSAQQQKFLNSLIRYRKGNATLRIGARLYGIKTYRTLGSGEPIKRDAEYESIVLDARLREPRSKYKSLAVKLVLKRLETVQSTQRLTDEMLQNSFEELAEDDYYRKVSNEIVAARDRSGYTRPHIVRFKEAIQEVINDPAIVQALIKLLECPEHPLIEKLNLLAFYKKFTKGCNVLNLAKTINQDSITLLSNGRKSAPEHYDLYSHFSSDLLAQLRRDFGKKPVYAGFKTLVRISQGVLRNLLSLLKHIYRRSVFLGEEPFSRGMISVESQTQGIQDAAEWFWEDAQPDEHGSLVRGAVEHLATLIRSIRYSENPSECDLCSFLINRETLSKNANDVLKIAENWSFIVSVRGASSAKNDDRVLSKFQINPMLAARWGISESRRGSIELKAELAEALFTEVDHVKTQNAINSRIETMNFPKLFSNRINSDMDKRQVGLFDDF